MISWNEYKKLTIWHCPFLDRSRDKGRTITGFYKKYIKKGIQPNTSSPAAKVPVRGSYLRKELGIRTSENSN